MYNEILSLKADQENFKLEMKTQIEELNEDLVIEVTSNEKATLNMCTKLICDGMAAHPSVIALGPNPSWGLLYPT
ncbi:hypothetical protein PHYBLDRAFT_153332 [Phycomyces blakesleeanus NRRL 1555(-)]|uniref:Uncharacterized protein n=1 Tax=Phycomyces blakesleeanus (strain ATCC 8743b / DSM 1359 / FGSC 10004 / NBRC 33097 / NRRL 1555) TaxID=763407 RepID=A0A162T245_PHYB8|nr:hypothetical protein PHYBLDRAFT_153332 [Phycomyces blakesleeanus NRRL 1555(-)]OAD65642.1 hypothetical protein PHYBLDRAFT_153332 [Phycomyces blakesleeanus NRRL 1555(-)]|eukprot:XP_018283682.1 hypothetical protein PHYBLDRAFT_153332 [Phycomyces blakesleeanus NRRL 1555(-)]